MCFRVFGFILLVDFGQFLFVLRLFIDEVMNYFYNNEVLFVIILNIYFNSEEEFFQVFVIMKIEYCWNYFKDLGKYYEIFI